jgi:hypothetical protein
MTETAIPLTLAILWVVGAFLAGCLVVYILDGRIQRNLQRANDADEESYNVPDPRIRELNKKIEAERAKHKPVKHLMRQRTEIAHEGLRQ